MSPNVRIRPVRVLGTSGHGTSWSIAQGILYAAGLPASTGSATVQAPSPAHIINLSLGAPNASAVIHAAVQQASGAGVLLVASAGNTGTSAFNYPAAFPEVLAVSATDPWFNLSSYSNYGSWVDLAAPGGSGGPDFTNDVFSTEWNFQDSAPSWWGWPGTSMAAPHVSGVAALVFGANPGITAEQVRHRLVTYTNPIGPAEQFGAGLVHAFSALTQGQGFSRELYVRLVCAESGREIQTVQAGPGGRYGFSRLDDGHYYVLAGTDEGGDGRIGVPNRHWGAHGGITSPSHITIHGGTIYEGASFTIGLALEREPNNQVRDANFLAMGGHVNGWIDPSTDQDYYRVLVGEAGTYTFQTHGWLGACGLAAQVNTAIDLLLDGTVLATNVNRDAAAHDFCSEITRHLEPGLYHLRVTSSTSGPPRSLERQSVGYYRISARPVN